MTVYSRQRLLNSVQGVPMLSSLHKDHLNIQAADAASSRSWQPFANEQPVSYFPLRDVVDTSGSVRQVPPPEGGHDLRLLPEVQGGGGEVANRLHEEHARLLDAGTELKEMVEMILMDAVILLISSPPGWRVHRPAGSPHEL